MSYNQSDLDQLSTDIALALQLQEYENPSSTFEQPASDFGRKRSPAPPRRRAAPAPKSPQSPVRARARRPAASPAAAEDPFNGNNAWFDATDREMADFGPGVWREMQRQALEAFQAAAATPKPRRGAGGTISTRPTRPTRPSSSSSNRPRGSSTTTTSTPKNAHTITGGECISCMETITGMGFKTACNHRYCKTCAVGVITASLTGGAFPPSCCSKPFSNAVVKSAISAADYRRYTARVQETTAKVLLYCPKPRCAKQIPETAIHGPTAQCPSCKTKVCTLCKAVAHAGVCKEDKASVELQELARGKGWQQCPKCQAVVEKTGLTCNEVKCQCNEKFCYKCGRSLTQTRGCGCPLFDAVVVDALNSRERTGMFDGGVLEADSDDAREWGLNVESSDEDEMDFNRDFQHARPYITDHVRPAPLPPVRLPIRQALIRHAPIHHAPIRHAPLPTVHGHFRFRPAADIGWGGRADRFGRFLNDYIDGYDSDDYYY